MNLIDAIIYGAIQGFSEFLPISSSGHLALIPHVMHIQDPGVVFDLMMHLGTALAVLVYFRKEILIYIKTLTPSLLSISGGTSSQWFSRNFILSTVVSVFFILLWIIIFNLSFFGSLLWFADHKNKKMVLTDFAMEKGMQWKLAIIIGAAQAIAIFPGVSRSGITLTAALLLGMKRKEAGSFSFLMSLPIILAGIAKELPDLMNAPNEKVMVLFLGVLTSFLVGFLTIHFFMKLIGSINLKYFAFYRWFVAIIMIVLLKF